MVSFQGAVTSAQQVATATVSMLTKENLALREQLARTEQALREARIELSQLSAR